MSSDKEIAKKIEDKAAPKDGHVNTHVMDEILKSNNLPNDKTLASAVQSRLQEAGILPQLAIDTFSDPKVAQQFQGKDGRLSQQKLEQAAETGKVDGKDVSATSRFMADALLKRWDDIATDGRPGISMQELKDWGSKPENKAAAGSEFHSAVMPDTGAPAGKGSDSGGYHILPFPASDQAISPIQKPGVVHDIFDVPDRDYKTPSPGGWHRLVSDSNGSQVFVSKDGTEVAKIAPVSTILAQAEALKVLHDQFGVNVPNFQVYQDVRNGEPVGVLVMDNVRQGPTINLSRIAENPDNPNRDLAREAIKQTDALVSQINKSLVEHNLIPDMTHNNWDLKPDAMDRLRAGKPITMDDLVVFDPVSGSYGGEPFGRQYRNPPETPAAPDTPPAARETPTTGQERRTEGPSETPNKLADWIKHPEQSFDDFMKHAATNLKNITDCHKLWELMTGRAEMPAKMDGPPKVRIQPAPSDRSILPFTGGAEQGGRGEQNPPERTGPPTPEKSNKPGHDDDLVRIPLPGGGSVKIHGFNRHPGGADHGPGHHADVPTGEDKHSRYPPVHLKLPPGWVKPEAPPESHSGPLKVRLKPHPDGSWGPKPKETPTPEADKHPAVPEVRLKHPPGWVKPEAPPATPEAHSGPLKVRLKPHPDGSWGPKPKETPTPEADRYPAVPEVRLKHPPGWPPKPKEETPPPKESGVEFTIQPFPAERPEPRVLRPDVTPGAGAPPGHVYRPDRPDRPDVPEVPKPAPEIDPAHRWDPPPEEKPPDWYQKLNDGQKWQVLKDALDEAAKTGKYEQVPRWMKTPIGWASPWPTRSVPDDWID